MMKNITSIMVCRYVQDKKQLSIRSISKLVSVHHRSWQRYLRGDCVPCQRVKRCMIRLMQVNNYHELIEEAYAHHRRYRMQKTMKEYRM